MFLVALLQPFGILLLILFLTPMLGMGFASLPVDYERLPGKIAVERGCLAAALWYLIINIDSVPNSHDLSIFVFCCCSPANYDEIDFRCTIRPRFIPCRQGTCPKTCRKRYVYTMLRVQYYLVALLK